MQNQLSHKPVHDQLLLADAAVKLTEKERQYSSKLSEASNDAIHDGLPHEKGNSGAGEKGKKRKEKEPAKPDLIKHPYKGHHIDLSL